MAIVGIVALSRNNAIGKGGVLPWHHSSDLKFFKQKTSGNVVVMGYNTWASIGRPLPERTNIVLSRTRDLEPDSGVLLMRSREEVLRRAASVDCDTYIIGGAEVYRLFSDDIERWYVTEVPDVVEDADAFMKDDFLEEFELTGSQGLEGGLVVKTYDRPVKRSGGRP